MGVFLYIHTRLTIRSVHASDLVIELKDRLIEIPDLRECIPLTYTLVVFAGVYQHLLV